MPQAAKTKNVPIFFFNRTQFQQNESMCTDLLLGCSEQSELLKEREILPYIGKALRSHNMLVSYLIYTYFARLLTSLRGSLPHCTFDSELMLKLEKSCHQSTFEHFMGFGLSSLSKYLQLCVHVLLEILTFSYLAHRDLEQIQCRSLCLATLFIKLEN